MRASWVGARWLGLIWLFGCAAAALGQAVKDYAGESLVIERSDTVYKMAADGTGVQTQTMAARIQSDAALRQAGVLNIGYAASSQRVEFAYVRARHPDGTIAETPGTEAIEIAAPVTREAPFYSDLKQKQLPVRNLKVGDTLEWQIRLIRTKAEAPGEFWSVETFTKEAVVLSETLELRVPKDKYVKVWSPEYKPAETAEGDERVFRWQYAALKPTVGPEADKEKEAAKKKVWTAEQELDAKDGKLPDVAWTTFRSWEEVGAWYRKLEADRIAASDDVKAKVAEVTAGKTTEEDKVKAVYSYVATNVRYIGVAFGIGRYQPHEAAEVLQNQYGDCKDKHTLLAAMLSALGLHPDAVLVGVGIRFNPEVPSPAAFNHLITRVAVDGKPVWLDTTAEVAPYRVLVFAVRDRQVLVVPETGEARLDRTPADLPFPAFQTMEANGSLDKAGTATSRMVLTLRGDDEVYIRAVLRQVSPAQYDELVQRLSQSMGYGGTVSHAQVSRLEDTGEPLKISYDYKRDRVNNWDDHQVVPQVAPVTLPMVDEKDPPVQAIALGIRRVETSSSALRMPDGWTVELPEAIHAKSAYATVDQTYRFEKGVMYSDRKVEVLREKVPVAEWKQYKKFADAGMLGSEQYVQLVHVGADDKTVGAISGGKASNPEAAKLIVQAMKALQQLDSSSAKKMLDEAKELNPEQLKLWSAYGALDMMLGAPTAAISDFNKELALHPNSSGVYSMLADLQVQRGMRKEAEASLRKWQAQDERNPVPARMLATMLLEDGDASAAAAEAKAAYALILDGEDKDERLELVLGKAQLKSGLKEPGRLTLVDLLNRTDDPGMMNDAAYELADAGLELPLAEKSTRTALDRMESESRSWTLDESPQTLRQKTQLIEATWDTLGWVLFREGKTAAGEEYIRAAWLNRQTSEVGEHIAEIALARGDRNAALEAYELALATLPWESVQAQGSQMIRRPTHPDGVEEKKLTAKADALRKAGALSSLKDPHDALQKMRVVPLGPADGLDGSAEYRLLLSAEKVDKVEAVNKPLAGGDERLLKLKLTGWVPKGSAAELEKVARLNCHAEVCEVIFEP